MKILRLILFVPVLFMVYSCSSSEKTTKNMEKKIEIEPEENVSELNLQIEKNVGWINLMPGTKPKFHVSGKLALLKGDSYNNEKTVLNFIKIYQSGKEIYFIKPKVREEYSIEIKSFVYSTIRGLSLNQDLNTKKSVNFEFLFSDGNEKFNYSVNNIMIEEVH